MYSTELFNLEALVNPTQLILHKLNFLEMSNYLNNTIDYVLDNWDSIVNYFLKKNLLIVGFILVISVYVIIGLHVYTVLVYVSPALFKRMGCNLTNIWLMVGTILLYNIVFNHLLAWFVKPGSNKDLRQIENLRK